ncbi:MAG: heparinase II/III family protein [Carnobacterium sp.]|nr:heparinase II/III family protein [Carnobacterium sp.]
MKKEPYKYVEWTKHAYDFPRDMSVISFAKDTSKVSITAHPHHPVIILDLDKNIIEQVYKEPKSLQLYFFGLVWIGFCDFEKKDEVRVIKKIIFSLFDYAKDKPNLHKNEMIWDDHALSERACVLLYLKDHFEDDELLEVIDQHLHILTLNLDIIIASDKWKENNHRIFHLCAKLCLELVYKNDSLAASFYMEKIESFFLELIDVEIGIAVEQAVAYYNFDIILLKLVSSFVINRDLSFRNPKLNINDIERKKNNHILALSFPNGELPASGDTPLGLKVKPKILDEEDRKSFWKGLERQGHYRGASKNNKFHYHLLSHNEESAHGHKSPLHIDLWAEDIGMVLVDSGGPYKYGDSLRYSWFRASKAHNTVSFEDSVNCEEEIIVQNDHEALKAVYTNNNSFIVRKLYSDDRSFFVNDFIKSENDWCLNFHFSPDLVLKQIDDSSFEVFKNNKSLAISFSLSNDIDLHVYGGYITSGSGKKELTSSIAIKGSLGIFEVNCRITKNQEV